MGILGWIVFGLIVGLVARAVMPGKQDMGIIWTLLLGIAGSLAGGWVASFFTGVSYTEMHGAGFIGSVLGAIALLAIGEALYRRRGHAKLA